MDRPKVLVVDDLESLHYSYCRRLNSKVRYFSAQTLEQARQVFQEYPDLAAIAVDACLDGQKPDTLDLVAEFRRTFTGPMIAISGDPDFNVMLTNAGCNYFCDKVQFPTLLLLILNLDNPEG